MLETNQESTAKPGVHTESEVSSKRQRRTFSAAYKLKILAEADRCTELGEIGLLLRREGLYSSQLHNWRSWREEMGQTKKRKTKTSPSRELKKQNAKLERENRRLKLKLERAEALIDLQKKAAEILNGLDEEEENES